MHKWVNSLSRNVEKDVDNFCVLFYKSRPPMFHLTLVLRFTDTLKCSQGDYRREHRGTHKLYNNVKFLRKFKTSNVRF